MTTKIDDSQIANVAASKLTGTVATARLGSGTADATTFLRGDQTWQTSSSSLPDPVTVAHGGTGAITLTNHGVLLGQGTSTVAATAVGSTNTVLHGSTGADPSFSAVVEGDITLADVTTINVTSTKHGLAPKSPADATQFLNGAATPAFAAVKDSDLSTSDITTNNVSTSKHGFAPKAPNDATKFLDGTGAWTVPAGGGGSVSKIGVTRTTSTNTAAENIATVAVSGLAQDDGLKVFVTVDGGPNTNTVALRNTTSGNNLVTLDSNNTNVHLAEINIRYSAGQGWMAWGAQYNQSGGGSVVYQATGLNLAAWTGSFNLAINHQGTGGSTANFTLAVYKVSAT